MIHLDGSYGEGGGQILRTALVLSLLTGEPFRIEDIRRGRPQPGLKPQHAHILKALLMMSDSGVDTVQPGATAITFQPGALRGGDYVLEIGTAGAIPLFLQTILPVSLFAPSPVRFTVTGGTDVRGAMSMDFWRLVLLPFLAPYAQTLELDVLRRGFYPKGGGQVQLRTVPLLNQENWHTGRSQLPPLALAERGEFQRAQIRSFASRDLRAQRVATRQAAASQNRLGLQPAEVEVGHVESDSPGSVVTAVAGYTATRLGVCVLGERGKSSEQVGTEAADALRAEMAGAGTVDVHTADNLTLWVALFGGEYTVAEVSGHLATNVWTIEHFLPGRVRIEGARVRSADLGNRLNG
jgi:RNA 3'-terminal phosphate cyclase (ATP)